MAYVSKKYLKEKWEMAESLIIDLFESTDKDRISKKEVERVQWGLLDSLNAIIKELKQYESEAEK